MCVNFSSYYRSNCPTCAKLTKPKFEEVLRLCPLKTTCSHSARLFRNNDIDFLALNLGVKRKPKITISIMMTFSFFAKAHNKSQGCLVDFQAQRGFS